MIALEEGERGHMGKDDEERVSDLQEHLAMSELMDGIKSGRCFLLSSQQTLLTNELTFIIILTYMYYYCYNIVRFFRGVLRAVEQWTNCHILVGVSHQRLKCCCVTFCVCIYVQNCFLAPPPNLQFHLNRGKTATDIPFTYQAPNV